MLSRSFGLLLATAALVLSAVTPGLAQVSPSQGGPRVILSLGNDQFIPKVAIEATTGARFQSDLQGLRFLDEVSVIVLADIPFAQLPPILQSSLVRWVDLGGSLLVTGGNASFGFGGYVGTDLGAVLPLVPGSGDRTSHGFSPTYVLNQGHPLFAGVTTTTMANFNETTVRQDASLLLEYRGVSKGGAAGAGITGGGRPFTTVTTAVVGPGGRVTRPSAVILGPAVGSGLAGTPGVGGQAPVPIPNIPSGTPVAVFPTGGAGAPVATTGTTVTPGAGGQGGAIGLPVPPPAPSSPLVGGTPVDFGQTIPSGPVNFGQTIPSGPVNFGQTIPSGPGNIGQTIPSGPANIGQTIPSGPGNLGEAPPPSIVPPPPPTVLGMPTTPTPTNTPGVLANPVLPGSGALDAGGVPPGTFIITSPGAAPGTVVITQTGGLPGQNVLGADPGFATEGGIQGGGRAAMPLIAERRQGQGLITAIAVDMNATGEWQDRANLTINAIRHLLDQSKLPLYR